MDYIGQIRRFNELLPSSRLSAPAIVMWYALMYLFSRSGWCHEMAVGMRSLEELTKLSRYTLARERRRLVGMGLIRYERRPGRRAGFYEIMPLSETILAQLKEQVSLQDATSPGGELLHGATKEGELLQGDTKRRRDLSHGATESAGVLQDATRRKVAIKEKNKERYMDKDKHRVCNTFSSFAPKNDAVPSARNVKVGKPKPARKTFDFRAWVASLEEPWRGLMGQWLDYKASRRESYKSESGAAKCLTMLRNMSGNDPRTAQSIIDRSIACNYAGIFPLKGGAPVAAGPAGAAQHGQRIGQIKQPESEERRQRLLERLSSAGKKNGNNQ